jgi:hypothetical protein
LGRAQFELSFRVRVVLNHFRNGVELPDAVAGFDPGFLVRIGD